LTFEAIV